MREKYATAGLFAVEALDSRILLSGNLHLTPFKKHRTTPVLSAPLFSPTTVGQNPDAVALGDFNGDKKVDALIVQGTQTMLMLGTGTGTFGTGKQVGGGTNLSSVQAADFNGDGKLDFVTVGENVQVELAGTHSFKRVAVFNPGQIPQTVVLGDFNRDHRIDLAVTCVGSETVSLILATGPGTFAAPVSFGGGPGAAFMATGDFNNDRKLDLMVADLGTYNSQNNTFATNSGLTLLLGNGKGSLHSGGTFSVPGRPAGIQAADFNKDGKLDVVCADGGLAAPDGVDDVSVLLGNGKGSFQTAANFATGRIPEAVVVSDFNHDGNLDIVSGNFQGIGVSFLAGNGAGLFATAQNFAAGSGAGGLALGDVNGDGKQDVVTANFLGTSLSTLLDS